MYFQTQLFSKRNHSSCLTKTGDCYLWGNNGYGQLGTGEKVTKRTSPTLLTTLPTNQKIISLACGEHHSLCLTEGNDCYAWGYNGSGQLGLGDRITRDIPTQLVLPNNERVDLISCGSYHSMCLTKNNTCYAWGANGYGQLGLGDRTDRIIPTKLELENNERITFITCGYQYSICLTEKGECLVWGENDSGQLGLGKNDVDSTLIPCKLKLGNNERICFISCGSIFTLCLTEQNDCYIWGGNNYGQLGLGLSTQSQINTPTKLILPNNEKISYIICGDYHAFCLTTTNECYAWGANDYGQLGLSDSIDRDSPTKLELENNERIAFITCGCDYTMCVTEENNYYVWGKNTYGQLGLGINDRNVNKPRKLNL